MIRVLIAMLLLAACGGIPDTSDIDTHVLRISNVDYFDGTSETIVKDLGFDRDAYFSAVDESAKPTDDSWIGSVEQGLVVNGRYGIDSQAPATSTDTRCPNNPPYTGNPAANPGGNYCSIGSTKTIAYFIDSSIEDQNDKFSGFNPDHEGFLQNTAIAQAFVANNSGTSFNNTFSTVSQANSKFEIKNQPNSCGGGVTAPMCTVNEVSPIVLAPPSFVRTRKWKADASGKFGHIYTDFDYMYSHGFLSATVSTRTAQAKNMFQHEGGHMMGLGHRPNFAGEARNPMSLVAGISSAVTYTADQKSELTSYVP